MKELTTDNILKGIVDNDRAVIEYVYDKYFNAIKNYVIEYGGTKEDAWDIFQDGVVIIYEQLKTGQLEIKSSFMTYFFTICKYQWLKIIREKNKKYYESIENNKEVEQINLEQHAKDLDETIEKEKRVKLYTRNFTKLSSSCQEILKLVAKGLNVKEITKKLGYKSNGFTYKKRRTCKERLTKLIELESQNSIH